MAEAKWQHDALADDLAGHLAATRDRQIWTNMQMGPSGSPRPDVYTIPKSFIRFTPLSYEIKISVADYRRDVTAGKWQKYLEFSSGVIFAVPAGLITKADIPAGCGLMTRGEEGWHTVKAPTLKHVDNLDRSAWMKLMIDGIERQRTIQMRELNEWKVEAKLSKKFGDEVAHLVFQIATAPSRLKTELEQIEAIHRSHIKHLQRMQLEEKARFKASQDQINADRAVLCEALGLDPLASAWEISRELRVARDLVSRDKQVDNLRKAIERVSQVIQNVAPEDIHG